MTADKLKLNDDKTELIVIRTRAQLDKISISELSIDHVKVSAVCNVRNLGTWFDNHLSMKTAINKTCQSGLYHLHNMGRMKRFLSFEDRKSIVQAIVMSRIDYCNSLLYGVAATNLSKLQRVLNAAVRLVCSLPRHEHVTSSFIRLHSAANFKFRINFKIAMLCFKCIHGHAPNYLKSMVTIKRTSDIQPPLEHQYPVERPFTMIEKNAWRSSLFQCILQDLEQSPAIITLTFKSLIKAHYFREAFSL